MTAVDWSDNELVHRFSVEMIDPIDRRSVLGVLPIYDDRGSVTWISDTGSSVSATIEVPDWTQWVENSWLRIVHEVAGTGYRQILGTFFVWDEGTRLAITNQEAKPQLMSCLKALEGDLLTGPLFVGEGAMAKAALAAVFDETAQPFRFDPALPDYRMSAVRVYDAGRPKLEVAEELAYLAGGELVPGDDGVTVIRRHVEPSVRSPSFTLDADGGGIVFDAHVSRNSDSRQTPSRSIVTWAGDEEGGQGSVSGHWDLGPASATSAKRRGYTIAKVHELGDMPGPKTSHQAQLIAKTYLPDDSAPTTSWDIETAIVPVRGGDVVSFRPPGSTFRKCVAKSVQLDMGGRTMAMTLQEV